MIRNGIEEKNEKILVSEVIDRNAACPQSRRVLLSMRFPAAICLGVDQVRHDARQIASSTRDADVCALVSVEMARGVERHRRILKSDRGHGEC